MRSNIVGRRVTFDRLPELAKDLVRRGVAVLVATGGEPSAFAAKSATATVPIVFSVGGDPVVTGLVGSLSRPGGNLTGVSLFTQLLEAKRIELLHEAIPSATTIAILINSTSRCAVALLKDAEEGARRLGVRLVPLWAGTENDFEPAFAKLIQERAAALVVGNSPFFNNHRDRLVALSARFRVPTIYEFREFAAAGGLMSYGTNLADAYRQKGVTRTASPPPSPQAGGFPPFHSHYLVLNLTKKPKGAFFYSKRRPTGVTM